MTQNISTATSWTYAKKNNGYQILHFKQITEYANSQKLLQTSKWNNKKSNNCNIKPGWAEQYQFGQMVEKNLVFVHKEKKSRDPNIFHLLLIQKDINIKLNSIKDEQIKKKLKMTQIQNVNNNKKKQKTIKYAWESLQKKRKRYYENVRQNDQMLQQKTCGCTGTPRNSLS